MNNEHFRKLDLRKIDESDRYIWYVSSTGRFFRHCPNIDKWKELTGNLNDKEIKINFVLYTKARLVAKHFHPKFDQSLCVGFLDGNQDNIHISNLYLYTKRQHGKNSGWKSRSRKVAIKEKYQDPQTFRSVRQAAKYLYCSYQTLLDYLDGKVNKSVVDNQKRKIYYVS